MPQPDPAVTEAIFARHRAWIAAGRHMNDEQRRKADDHLERTSVEMGGPIPARFKHLQYLNEERDKRV
jgi:hypothetical protein